QSREIYIQLTEQLSTRWKLKVNATSWDQTSQYDFGYFGSAYVPVSDELPIYPTFQYSARPNTLNRLALDATLTGRFDVFAGHVDIAVGGDLLQFTGNTAIDYPNSGGTEMPSNAYS